MPGKQAWLRCLGCAACVALAALLAMPAGPQYLDRWRLQRDSREHVAELAGALEAARASHKQATEQFVRLAARAGAPQAQLPPAAAMLAQVRAALEQCKPALNAALPDAAAGESHSAFLAGLARRKAEAQSAQAVLAQAQGTLQRLALLLGAQSALLELQRQHSEAVLWNAPPIRRQVRAIQLALEQADGAGVDSAQLALRELGTQLTEAAKSESHLKDVRATVAQLGGMGLSGDDRKRVNALARAAATAAGELDAALVKQLAAQAEALLHARAPQGAGALP